MYSAKRKSFFVAVICLVLCVALLIGTTFAWFTDSVSNTGNKVQAGTLDIALGQYNGSTWDDISTSSTPVFNSGGSSGNLWEPGYSQYAVLKVSNEGNLAFKYRLDIVKTSPDKAVNICDAIDVYALISYTASDVEKSAADVKAMLDGGELKKIGTLSQLMADGDGAAYGILYPQSEVSEGSRYQSAYAMLVLKMPETAGNEYQGSSAEFDIRLRAAQYTYEKDGFGSNLYDQNAAYDAAETENGYITFSSANPFTLSTSREKEEDRFWDGTLSYLTPEASDWQEWDGTGISAAKDSTGAYKLYLRGKGNSTMNQDIDDDDYFKFDEDAENIKCSGNIMTLLNYDNPNKVITSSGAFAYLFYECRALAEAPSLPATTLSNKCYYQMFKKCSNLISGPSCLPAKTLTNKCYQEMFSGCSLLKTAPQLNATTLAENCYYEMFEDCAALEAAPQLNATTLANNCYNGMFDGCTSLEEAPALPATTLANNCYRGMFDGCTKLKTAPELAAEDLAESCYSQMFKGCTSLEAAPELNAKTLADFCYLEMFKGCTSLKTAPELNAKTLTWRCYAEMFTGCTSLETAPVIKATDFTADDCCKYMFNGCSKLSIATADVTDAEKFVTIPNTIGMDAVTGMFEGTIMGTGVDSTPGPGSYKVSTTEPTDPYLTFSSSDEFSLGTLGNLCYTGSADAKVEWSTDTTTWTIWAANGNKPANITAVLDTADSKYKVYLRGKDISSFFNETIDDGLPTSLSIESSTNTGVECSGSIMTLLDYENPDSVTMGEKAFQFLFMECGKLTTAPSLPAKTLTKGCYYYMFGNCSSLETAPELPATILADECYNGMFTECTKLNTAPALPATTLAEYCYNGMFDGCTALINASQLSAHELKDNCYKQMFKGCTSLITAPDLPATEIATSCYTGMFLGCIALKNAPAISATKLAFSCCSGMFKDCTSLTTAPALNATELATSCYANMFQNCQALKNAPSIQATKLNDSCCQGMFEGCTNLKVSESPSANKIFTCPAGDLPTNAVRNMFKDTGGSFTNDPSSGKTYYWYIEE